MATDYLQLPTVAQGTLITANDWNQMVNKLNKAIKEIMVVEKLILGKDIILSSTCTLPTNSSSPTLTNATYTLPTDWDFIKLTNIDLIIFNWGRYPTSASTTTNADGATIRVTYGTGEEYAIGRLRGGIAGYEATNQTGVTLTWEEKLTKPSSSAYVIVNYPERYLPTKTFLTNYGSTVGVVSSQLRINNTKLQLNLSYQYYRVDYNDSHYIALDLPLHIEVYKYTTLNVQV